MTDSEESRSESWETCLKVQIWIQMQETRQLWKKRVVDYGDFIMVVLPRYYGLVFHDDKDGIMGYPEN